MVERLKHSLPFLECSAGLEYGVFQDDVNETKPAFIDSLCNDTIEMVPPRPLQEDYFNFQRDRELILQLL